MGNLQSLLSATRNGMGDGEVRPFAEPTRFARLVSEMKSTASGEVISLGARELAVPLREDVEDRINTGQVVELDFSGVVATQSFMDELVGILVLERGPSILSMLRFRRCSPEMKGILQFVVDDRAMQHLEAPRFRAPR